MSASVRKKHSATQSMVRVSVRMDGQVTTAQHELVQMVCTGKTVTKCANAYQKTQKCVIHGQASVFVKQDGMVSCVLDLAHFIHSAKDVGMFAHARTMHSACRIMEPAYVPQGTEATTVVIFVHKEHSVKNAHSVVSAKMQHFVPLIQDDASANQVGLASSAIDLATNTSMATTVLNSASARTTLLVNHRMVLAFVHQAMPVDCVMTVVNKALMAEVVNRNVTVIKKTH